MNFVLMLALAQALPDGAGKAVTERMCKGCHGLDNVVRARFTEDKWAEVVDDMVSRGAKGTDDEVDQVIKYLSAHFGPRVNVNKAGASDLKESLGISAADADAIVQYRTEKGTFKSIQDLMKVPGIDAKKIESLKDRVEF
jgi:competence protein ComEA